MLWLKNNKIIQTEIQPQSKYFFYQKVVRAFQGLQKKNHSGSIVVVMVEELAAGQRGHFTYEGDIQLNNREKTEN